MKRTPAGSLALLCLLAAASCSKPTGREEPVVPEPNAGALLRLDLTNETADAAEPRSTTVQLTAPADWRTSDTFTGAWTQPDGAPTLMLVASGFDDGRRSGTYQAHRENDRFSIDLHPTFADNNITLFFTRDDRPNWAGEWGHSTFAGYRQKGPVRVSSPQN